MRKTYEQACKKIKSAPAHVCSEMEAFSVEKWKQKFRKKSHKYGTQNGNFPVPPEVDYYP
jgi:hypothetical protein